MEAAHLFCIHSPAACSLAETSGGQQQLTASVPSVCMRTCDVGLIRYLYYQGSTCKEQIWACQQTPFAGGSTADMVKSAFCGNGGMAQCTIKMPMLLT